MNELAAIERWPDYTGQFLQNGTPLGGCNREVA